jgi:hypothetical protein
VPGNAGELLGGIYNEPQVVSADQGGLILLTSIHFCEMVPLANPWDWVSDLEAMHAHTWDATHAQKPLEYITGFF